MDIDIVKEENIVLTKLEADDGMVLTNGESHGKTVYLGVNDSAENWREVPESEIPETTYENLENAGDTE